VPTEEVNKANFKRYLEEAWNQSNLEVVDEIFDRYVSHQPDGSVLERGPEDVKRFVGEFRTAFPDLRLIIEEQIAEGDKVVSRGTIRGTHQGEFRGMAPTGEEMEIKGMAIFRFSSEGKVVESWDSYDQLSLMRHDARGEMFGFPRLWSLVAERGKERSLGNVLMEELYSFVGEGWEQEDDITLLSLRRSPTGS